MTRKNTNQNLQIGHSMLGLLTDNFVVNYFPTTCVYNGMC